ncbi:MAG TPA: carboxypeptidase-like regulatory domain-containing protein [Kofleriaceae bacterium]|nr:carboxypeptidase-like regulatory domain-containing protein [Kofleriaceae bacterium]
MRQLVVLLVAGCGAAQHAPARRDGAIGGLARDHDSGVVIAKAAVVVRAQGELAHVRRTVSNPDGSYLVDHLPPGEYSVEATFAGQPLDIEHVGVRTGEVSYVDLTFTLGRPDPVRRDFGDPKQGQIDHYRPPHLAHEVAIVEGTVNDTGTHERVAGAVVTAIGSGGGGGAPLTLQTVSDDQGRYRFDRLVPGSYTISAYYSIGGRGQIEVRRSGIDLTGGEAVIVPLWVELAGQ